MKFAYNPSCFAKYAILDELKYNVFHIKLADYTRLTAYCQ